MNYSRHGQGIQLQNSRKLKNRAQDVIREETLINETHRLSEI